LVLALVAVALPVQGAAQSWKPARNVELVAPSGAGGGSDEVARLVQRILQERKLVEVPLAVVNRPGAGGAIAWTSLNQHPGDGHYLSISTANLLTNHITGTSPLNYTDLTPIAQLFSESVAVAVRADSPIRNGKELLARLKADASSLSAAVGTSLGNTGHIALALVTRAAGGYAKKLKAVVFSAAAQGQTALLGGHVDLIASPASNLVTHHAEKRVRIIAVSSPARLAGVLADVPTWREAGADVVIDNLRGVVAPKDIPAPQIAYWESVLGRMVAADEWRQNLEKNARANSYTGSAGSRNALEGQYEQMRAGLTELGLARR
jgi:putative tricarboxylic transport membrane protein